MRVTVLPGSVAIGSAQSFVFAALVARSPLSFMPSALPAMIRAALLNDRPSPPAAARTRPVSLRTPVVHGDELGLTGRRWLNGVVLLAHLAVGWALLQVGAVRQTVAEGAPAIMIDMIAPPKPAPTPSPQRPAPQQPPSTPLPKRTAAAPTPLIAAAPSPASVPPSFVVPPAEAPLVAPAPPAPLAPPASPAPPAPPAPQVQPSASVARKLAGSALRYLSPPQLDFPLLSRRARESGEVLLRIVVDVNGRLKEAWVQKSSGFARIDAAALHDIRSARFVPHREDGQALEVESSAVLAYDLDR